MLKTSGLAEPLRDALAPMAGRIDLAFIYGSVARGEAHGGSDVDLLVVASEVTLEQLFARLERAERIVGRKINPTLLTPDEFRRRRRDGNPFLKKVLAGAMIPLIGSVDGQASIRLPLRTPNGIASNSASVRSEANSQSVFSGP